LDLLRIAFQEFGFSDGTTVAFQIVHAEFFAKHPDLTSSRVTHDVI